MAIEKRFNTRIVLTHDEYNNLKDKTLKYGEVILAKVGVTTGAEGQEPIWMMKVGKEGDNTTVANCPWLVAPAADVYDWAKQENLAVDDVPTLPIGKIDGLQTALDNKADKSAFDNHNHDSVYKKIQEAVAESGAADKTLKISQDAQGKISVTPVDIDIKASQINDFAVEVAKVKVANATAADEATKDASGNVITKTYATKNELTGAKTEVSNLANSIAGGIQNGNIVAAKATEADTLDGKHAADFAEAGHNHKASDLTDFSEDVKAVVNTMGLGTNDTILALTERMGTAEDDIDALQTAVTETIPGAIEDAADDALKAAKEYTDEVKAGILGEGITETFDTLKEIEDWIGKQGGSTVELTKAIAEEAKAREDADKAINDVIDTFGDIVTHNAEDFATPADVKEVSDYLGEFQDQNIAHQPTFGAALDAVADTAYVALATAGNASAQLQDKMDKVSLPDSNRAEEILIVNSSGNAILSGKKVTDFADADHNHDDKYAPINIDTGVMSVAVNADTGLKATNENGAVTIDFIEDVVFVLDGGTAANL